MAGTRRHAAAAARGWILVLVAGSTAATLLVGQAAAAFDLRLTASRPNILLILADDLGYGDLGVYGQRQVATPRLDSLAAAGLRFSQCYAGSTVCAPSRCALFTGLHTGHARVRGNSLVPLADGDLTLAEVLRQVGYVTGLVGKWGLGEPGTSGLPGRQGFDHWFGYLNQAHAHNYYPHYLWRGTERELLLGNRSGQRKQYAPDLFLADALQFLRQPRGGQPFFLAFTSTLPHANNERGAATGNGMEIPSPAPYEDRPWPLAQRCHAAMITRLDHDAGLLLDELERLGLAENTVVFFASDNGPHGEGGADPAFFNSTGPLRGKKRDLYEGGIRTPMVVRWPARIAPGRTSEEPWALWDLLPTCAELAGAARPAGLDGRSMMPWLVNDRQSSSQEIPDAPFFYWEFHEKGFQQAARWGRWKAIRLARDANWQLFDLAVDVGETHDLALAEPRVVEAIADRVSRERTDSLHWPSAPPVRAQVPR